jgi:hypothetical protein
MFLYLVTSHCGRVLNVLITVMDKAVGFFAVV